MRKGKKPIRSRPGLRTNWLWVVAGVAVIFVLFILARTLSQPPKQTPGPKPVELGKQDLDAYTRMLGRIFIDTTPLLTLSPDLRRQLYQIDTMISNRELRDAIGRLAKLKRKTAPLELAAIQIYTGFCYYELGQPTEALGAFQEGLKVLSVEKFTAPDTSEIRARFWAELAFNAGYLLQFYSLPESALTYYNLCRQALELIPAPSPEIAPALFNNIGVAAEKVGDTALAKQAYLYAVNYIDTTAANPAVERLKRNITRISAPPTAPAGANGTTPKRAKSSPGQHQP